HPAALGACCGNRLPDDVSFTRLPDEVDTKEGERLVSANHRKLLDEALRREHAIERVSVGMLETSRPLRVLGADLQLRESGFLHPASQVPHEALRLGEPSKTELGGDLPTARAGDEDFIGSVGD